MFHVCPECGQFRADKTVEHDVSICPVCGHRRRFVRGPLWVVGGASGTGKTTVVRALLGSMPEVVLLDSDVLWRDDDAADPSGFFERWLRLCTAIGQSGRPVLLFGAGFAVPDNLEPRIERRYVSVIHYAALVCDETVLSQRLRDRPAWRNSAQPETLAAQLGFNRWLRDRDEQATPAITRFDTTDAAVEQTAVQIRQWVSETVA